MQRSFFTWLGSGFLLLGFGYLFAWAQAPGPSVRRAEPPKFDATTTKTFFFNNALDEGLVGERPDLSKAAVAANSSSGGNSGGSAGGEASSGTGWSSIISAASIEDQIKSTKLKSEQNFTNPSDFAGKGYKTTRRDFTLLAMLFGIVGDYDGDVRFKAEAPVARDVLSRTAANAKVGTVQVFNETKLRLQELNDLVSGSNPYGGKEAERKPNWVAVCDRSPLMQHLELVYEPRLKQNLANEASFKSNPEEIVRDAQVIAAIGTVMMAEGMEDADGDDYKEFCQRMVKAGKDIVDGVKLNNYGGASSAATEIGRVCTECHENYRS